jgi:hypothetical protein
MGDQLSLSRYNYFHPESISRHLSTHRYDSYRTLVHLSKELCVSGVPASLIHVAKRPCKNQVQRDVRDFRVKTLSRPYDQISSRLYVLVEMKIGTNEAKCRINL